MFSSNLSVLTVSQLTTQIKQSLEQMFPEVWVEGEVSNLRIPSSGHVYFTLKDQQSQIRAVLFKGKAQHIPFELEDGLHVIIRGHVSLYELRGDYQIILEYVEPRGIGALHIAFEQLRKKLFEEGLFDERRKRPLPLIPKKVALITSPTGAAIRDMISVLQRRCPLIQIVVFPVRVQGEGASLEIAHAIQEVSHTSTIDLMIVGRGGGSLEDLWSFNEEVVVRAIANASIPVVSAVGHEIDFTLSDFASDVRAPTPSAAAEMVSPVLSELQAKIRELQVRVTREVQSQVSYLKQHLVGLGRSIPDLRAWVQQRAQRIDDANDRIQRVLNYMIMTYRPRVTGAQTELFGYGPQPGIAKSRVLAAQLRQRLQQGMPISLQFKRNRFQLLTSSLEAFSPLAILSRGYSVLETYPKKKIIRQFDQVEPGDHIRARLGKGVLYCQVEKTQKGPLS